MDLELFIQRNIPSLTLLLVAVFLCVLIAVVLGVLTLSARRVHPLVAGLAVGPCLLLTVGLTLWASGGRGDLQALQSATYVTVGVPLFALFLTVFPAFFGALMAAGGGALKGQRELLWPALAIVPGVVVVAAPVVSATMVGRGLEPLGYLRAGMYAPVLLLTLIALLSGGRDERAGPEAGALASLGFASFVAIAEAGGRSMFYFFMLGSFSATPDPVRRMTFLEGIRVDLLGPADTASWVAVLCAGLVGAIGVASVARSRGVSSLMGALWLLLLPLPLLCTDVPDGLWQALAEALM